MKKATLNISFDTNDEKNEAILTQVSNYASKLDGVAKVTTAEANDNKRKAADDNDAA
jgi:hypothetical protein